MTGPRPAGRPWTLTDDDMLRKLLASGMKAPAIALKMNRTVDSIAEEQAEGEEMSEPKTGLASLGLDNAIRLRWVLRDIVGKRLKFSPIAPNDLQTLIDLGYIEMKDEVPTVTTAGLDEIAIGNLPSDR